MNDLEAIARRGVMVRTVDEALAAESDILKPTSITVQKNGKWWEVLSYEF